jgi:hypothetical protein
LPAGRLWIVAVGDDVPDAAWQTWYETLVVGDWTAHLSLSSSTSSTNGESEVRSLADWQVLRGVPAYARALREWVQEEREVEPADVTASPWHDLDTAAAARLVGLVYQAVGGASKGPLASLSPSSTRPQLSSLVQDALSPPAVPLSPLREVDDKVSDGKEEDSVPTATSSPIASEDDSINDMVAPTTTTRETEPTLDLWIECEIIQAQLEDYWLDESSGSKKGPSLPPDVTTLLQPLVPRFAEQPEAEVEPFLAKLFHQHASILRDYYGRLAESLLQSGRASGGSTDNLLVQYQGAAQRVISLALPGLDDRESIFQQQGRGLQEDLVDLTEAWQATTEAWYEEEDDEPDNQGDVSLLGRRRLPPWLKRLSTRALVLGINYLQGWLAWQGLQRAALARERQVPKFPLF